MRTKIPVRESFIIDTYKSLDTGRYFTGVITYKGRKKMDSIQWKSKSFATQQEADAYARSYCSSLGLCEAGNEGEISQW